jgi:hypothetical protein
MSSFDQSREELLNAILDRAAVDMAFRRALLTDPQAAIYERFGVHIPADFRIKFVEKDPDVDALVVLPDPRPTGELSDGDLDVVAGGAHATYQWAPPRPPGGGPQ